MTIATEIQKLKNNLEECYTVCENKRADIPSEKNFDNLPDTIRTLQNGEPSEITVTTEPNAVVSYKGRTYQAIDGTATVYVWETGTINITASYNGHSQTKSVYIYYQGSYTSLSIPLKSVISVTATVGTRVTLEGETKTSTGQPLSFDVWETGNYTILGELEEETTTQQVNVSSLGATYNVTVVFKVSLLVYSNNGATIYCENQEFTITDEYIVVNVEKESTVYVTAKYHGVIKTVSVDVGTEANKSVSCYIIPSEYQEVEYIQSSGTQCIDTGLTSDTTKEIDVHGIVQNMDSERKIIVSSFLDSNTPSWGVEFTSATTAEKRLRMIVVGSSWGGEQTVDKYCNHQLGLNSDIEFDYNWNPTTKTSTLHYKNQNIEDTISNTKPQIVTHAGNNHVKLFLDNRSDTTAVRYPLRIKLIEIKINKVLQRVIIPCYRKSDNVIGVYDAITNQFIPNSGTGVFTKGNNVETYQQVEYIQSSGTQYMNLDNYILDGNSVELSVEVLTTGTVQILGAGQEDSRTSFQIAQSTQGNVLIVDRGPYRVWSTVVGYNTGKHKIFAEGNGDVYIDDDYVGTSTGSVTSQTTKATLFKVPWSSNLVSIKFNELMISSPTGYDTRLFPSYNTLGIIGAYDVHKHSFIQNSGTGVFTKGSDVTQ